MVHFVIFEKWTSNYEISISILCVHYVLWYIKLFLSKMPHFVILWEARVFFRFFNFVKNAQFCHFVRGPWIFSLLQFCQKCLILSFSERPVYFFASSILSKMLNFVIFWEARGFFRFLIFVKNAQFCHFLRDPCIFFAFSILSKMLNFVIFWEDRGFVRFFNFVKNTQFCHFLRGHGTFSLFNIVKNGPFCHFLKVHFKLWDKHKYTMCIHYVLWYIKLILSNLCDFVILWEARVFFRFFNFVKNAQLCHFLREESVFFFFTFSILSYMVHFVIFEKWTSNYEISISILWVHTMCCDIANYFCQKCPILSFCERLVYFFASSILSKMLNFVILCEAIGFFFNFSIFVKNGPFCHFWNADFKLWDKYKRILCIHYVLWYIKLFCQKCSILSFSERPVYFFASSILSKMINFVIFWEASAFFSIFQFLSKMVHFVIFETQTSNYDISIKEYYVYTMCCDISNYFCQKCPILSVCERLVYFFASSILSKMLNFVIFWEAIGFFSIFQFWSKMVHFVIF